ncbi:copper chaperone PCu(A)C [Pollutimonas harenae]|uniref:Copper chaperone PCu(A)C n=1 Tax=Pollutimonas harenae TaxID=657015 RepID=A0A853H212_9BURK|nr:copper chaperone PCu(A)C [Pollutimonas harenae]NYT86986.1 copper chaperone PCu(A)C [Pollutimonas harenae]
MKIFVLAGLIAFSGVALANSGHSAHTSQHGHAAADLQTQAAQAQPSQSIQVSGCWIRSLPAPAPSAGYFLIKNSGNHDVKLQAAVSSTYGMVMLHQTTQHDGMSKMSETHEVVIPAAGELEFKPGSYHAMLEQAKKAPAIGSQVAIDFLFDNGEKASAQCEVKPANTKAH